MGYGRGGGDEVRQNGWPVRDGTTREGGTVDQLRNLCSEPRQQAMCLHTGPREAGCVNAPPDG